MATIDNCITLLIDRDGRWDHVLVPSKILAEGRVVSMFLHIKITIETGRYAE